MTSVGNAKEICFRCDIYHSVVIAIEKSNFSRKMAKLTVFDALGIIESLKWDSEGALIQFTSYIKATNKQRPCKRHSACFLLKTGVNNLVPY